MAKVLENLMKITWLNFKKLSVFVGQKSILHHYYIQNYYEGIQTKNG